MHFLKAAGAEGLAAADKEVRVGGVGADGTGDGLVLCHECGAKGLLHGAHEHVQFVHALESKPLACLLTERLELSPGRVEPTCDVGQASLKPRALIAKLLKMEIVLVQYRMFLPFIGDGGGDGGGVAAGGGGSGGNIGLVSAIPQWIAYWVS